MKNNNLNNWNLEDEGSIPHFIDGYIKKLPDKMLWTYVIIIYNPRYDEDSLFLEMSENYKENYYGVHPMITFGFKFRIHIFGFDKFNFVFHKLCNKYVKYSNNEIVIYKESVCRKLLKDKYLNGEIKFVEKYKERFEKYAEIK
jgi:hypothetical protein